MYAPIAETYQFHLSRGRTSCLEVGLRGLNRSRTGLDQCRWRLYPSQNKRHRRQRRRHYQEVKCVPFVNVCPHCRDIPIPFVPWEDELLRGWAQGFHTTLPFESQAKQQKTTTDDIRPRALELPNPPKRRIEMCEHAAIKCVPFVNVCPHCRDIPIPFVPWEDAQNKRHRRQRRRHYQEGF
jgi:hypothetical protein